MQGMKFVVIGQNNQVINHGQIVQQINDDKFLCQFQRPPAVARLVHTDEIMGWNLFPNDELLGEFITHINKQNQPPKPADPAPGAPGLDIDPESTNKKASKKKASKKRSKKKANVKR
jgi:hypothetical protein